MPSEIVMPRMSDTMEQGRIVRWLKQPGEHVEKGEPLAEIETDKAVMQLESYESGTLERLLLPEGESAPIGQPIALIQSGQAAGVATPGARAPAAASQPAPATAPARPAAPAAPAGGAERVKASPIARRIAEEQGIDLAAVTGTGPGGRITREDVEARMAQIGGAPVSVSPVQPPPVPPAPPSVATVAHAPAPAAPPAAPSAEGQTVELSRMRRTIGERMVESKTTIPHFYVTNEVEMGAALELRRRLNEAWAPEAVGINAFLIRACALALGRFPDVNASYHDGRIEQHARASIGLAVALPGEGLLVPVVRDADQKGLRQIARESKALIERARSGHLISGDLGGATFTITNLGMYDVEEFIAIITPPEAAILAVGSIKPQPVVVDDQVRIGQRVRLTLSGDHRVFAGQTAAQFLQEVKRLLGNPFDLLQ